MYISIQGALRTKVLQEAHNALYSGHLGVTKLMADLKPLYFLPRLKRDVTEFVAKCLECQQVKG